MRHTAIFLLTALLSTIYTPRCEAGDNDMNAILTYMKMAMRFNKMCPQEKVYLHLDNTGYFMGETIRFKGYVVRADDGGPTDLSKVLYVELLNPSGDIVESRKLPVKDGTAYGDIKVDSLMTTGFYEVRAYTRHMTNWGSNACFSRILPIFSRPVREGDYANPVIDKISYRNRLNNEREHSDDAVNPNIVNLTGTEHRPASATTKDASLIVRIYPEGGNIVNGLGGKAAFTVTDDTGMPAEATCTLVANDGTTLCTTKTNAFGQGIVTFDKAVPDMKLKVTAKYRDAVAAMPKALEEGCTMTMDMADDEQLTLSICASQEVCGTLLGYVITHNGNTLLCDTLTADGNASRTFSRKKMPAGVSQITLFNSSGRIMAERLFFICPPQEHSGRVGVTLANKTIKPCGKLKLNISAEPNSSLSLSATDAASMVNGRSGNIDTWMLLSSEIRGFVSNPAYYFEADDVQHRQNADMLMLTQGWRRYDWQLMTGQSIFAKRQPIEDKLYLFGQLRPKSNRNPVNGVWLDTKLYNHQGQVVEGQTQTDSAGNYVFVLPDIDGEWSLSINTGVADKKGYWKDVNYYVAIDRNFSPEARYVPAAEAQVTPIDDKGNLKWTFTDEEEKWISLTNRNLVLQNVTVKRKGRVWDRTNWGDETSARKKSNIFYNCDTYADQIADEGEEMPDFCEWLKSHNSFFAGNGLPTQIYIGLPVESDSSENPPMSSSTGRKMVVDYNEYDPAHDENVDIDPPTGFIRFYGDGLTYKNRPIVWIIDNQFCTITNYLKRGGGTTTNKAGSKTSYHDIYISINNNATNAAIDLPTSLGDVKSVYISEDLEAMHGYFMSQEVDAMNPVILYCYTHRLFNIPQKGMRRTHYQGYNVPTTFEMEDYSVIPPMEDYRRTLYWAPDIKTDAQGKAEVEFWNNSSCSEMNISCEGMTPTGKALVY